MRTDATLRRFGWRQSRGKWISPGHSKPLTLTQAKAALARDLKSKDFDSLKKSGKLERAQRALDAGYQFEKGKFKKPSGRKPLTLDEVSKRQAKEELSAKNKSARSLGFNSDSQRKSVSDWTKDNLELFFRFVDQYDQSQGASDIETRALIARLLHTFKTGKTKSARQRALNDLLILVGYRTGNEPYPAGQTPPKK